MEVALPHLLRALVCVIAGLEALLIAMFAVFSLSGDSLGIARAMALLLSVPFVALTGPALLLMARGRLGLAAALALASLAATALSWLRA
jgi:hypothetical protein